MDADAANAPVRAQERVRETVSAFPATYLLLGINILVYALMFQLGPVPRLIRMHQYGAALTAPFGYNTLIQFGAIDGQRVLAGEWWRLVSSCFVHVHLLHLLGNMWCLWNLGLLGERLLGRRGLVAMYLLSGATGMTLSVVWNTFQLHSDIVTAGASGSVFGIAGALIVLLSNRGLSAPWRELRALRGQVVFFALANLAIGLGPSVVNVLGNGAATRLHLRSSELGRIDNMAHLGGFAAGIILALPLYPKMLAGKNAYRHRQSVVFIVGALLLALWVYGVMAAGR